MARAKARSWIKLVAGSVVGAAAQPLLAGAFLLALPGSALLAQTVSERPLPVHEALNNAIELHRHGDYEAAHDLFQSVNNRQGELTDSEKQDLYRFWHANELALSARQEGGKQLRIIDRDVQEGRISEAVDLLKKVLPNEQYLTPADRVHYKELYPRLLGKPTDLPRPIEVPRPGVALQTNFPPGPLPPPPTLADARAKLQQARAQLTQCNIDLAETLAHETERLGVTFPPAEDTPAKVLQDVAKARTEPKTLLTAARAAMGRQDFDAAEKYAKQSESVAGMLTFPMWGDSPSKVLKELKELKEAQAAKAKTQVAASVPSPVPPPQPLAPVVPVVATTTAPPAPTVTTTSNKPADPVPAASEQNEKARTLLRQSRKALEDNKLTVAKQLADQAKLLHPTLYAWEDTPEKLLADIAHAQALADARNPKLDASASPDKKMPTTKEEAVALVKQAKELLAEGKLDDAQVAAMKARYVKAANWGLFDDTPDNVLKDIDKARVKANQEESVKVLAEGRKLLAKGDWDGAMHAAYRAQGLHGPYQWTDWGDRPDKLLADAQELKSKSPKPAPATNAVARPPVTPPAPIQTVSNQQPATPPVPAPKPEAPPVNPDVVARNLAMQKLSEARAALRNNDIARAKALTDQVALMKVNYGPQDDCPALVYQEIIRASQTAAAPPSGNPNAGMPVGQPAPAAAAFTKERAMQLLAEAHQLQKADRLIEARERCLEVMKGNVVFAPEEESPLRVLQQTAVLAQHSIDVMSAQATELAQSGAGEPMARYQRAAQMLAEALTLCQAFGLDASTVNLKITWIQERIAQAPGSVGKAPQPVELVRTSLLQPAPQGPPQPVQPVVGTAPRDLHKEGERLLEQARTELFAGALSQARGLAMEATKEEYGIVEEAMAVLRSIDTEMVNRKVRDDRHTFDNAMIEYNRHDYAQASLLIGAIDFHNLDERRAQKLREIMQTSGMSAAPPEMMRVAQVEPPSPGAPNMQALPGSEGSASDTGHAHATDTQAPVPDKDVLKEAAARHSVLEQKLRMDGLAAQNTAAEKFRTGQIDEALDVLRQYLADLETVRDLEPYQVARLRTPIENRLKKFELLSLQEGVKAHDQLATSKTMDAHNKRLAAEQAKQKKIAELMQQCNDLVHDGKIDEAHRLALVIGEMAPENPAVAALVTLTTLKNNLNESLKSKKELEDFFFDALTDTDRNGHYLTNKNPIEFDSERFAIASKRKGLDQIITRKTKAMLLMESKLMTPVSINYKDVPLRQAVEDLRSLYGINFDFDDHTLQSQGLSVDQPITMRLDGVMLKTALELMLKKLNLSYIVNDTLIQITTKENAKGIMVRVTYPVLDLICPVEGSTQVPATPMLPGQGNPYTSPGLSNIGFGYQPPSPLSATSGGYSIATTGGTAVGQPMGPTQQNGDVYNPKDMLDGVDQYGHKKPKPNRMLPTREEALIKLITNTINPGGWADAGGPGTIDYFPMAGALVINDTADVQEQVADLLQALRRLQDQEVAIEVRLITVDEDYYEYIGVNFSMDIATNSRNDKFEPALLSNAFAPVNQFNTAATGAGKGLLGGLTPAGTFTPDLSIPISPNSFSAAQPTFGGYQGPSVGGLTMGLAFLSDIQVSLLIEAVAGDARSSISQSPRVMVQNGQQATITIIDNLENLNTGVTLVQLPNGAFALVPQIQPINNEVDLQISAVITADRRFVRITPQVNINNVSISNPAPAPTPILLPIYPTSNVADPGNSVVYTQYLQQPQRVSTINLTTTVTVPDGGTVVMGGLKRMSEGRLEYGPPVLSKIPYINRLFRNVGYGRSGSSILLMVTPRIIIQEEEEERATGFQIRPAVTP